MRMTGAAPAQRIDFQTPDFFENRDGPRAVGAELPPADHGDCPTQAFDAFERAFDLRDVRGCGLMERFGVVVQADEVLPRSVAIRQAAG